MTAIVVAVISLALTGLTLIANIYMSRIKTAMNIIWKYDDNVIPLIERIYKGESSSDEFSDACTVMSYIIQLHAGIRAHVASRRIVEDYLHVYLRKTWNILEPDYTSLMDHRPFTVLGNEYRLVIESLIGDVR